MSNFGSDADRDPGQRRIHPLLRFAVLDRDRFTCRYCGGRATVVDHVRPWTRGGETLPPNLVAACRACYLEKGERTPEEWQRDRSRERLRKRTGMRHRRFSRSR